MSKRVLCCLAVAVCLGMGTVVAPVSAQTCGPLDNGRLADVRYEGTQLQFDPIVEFQEMVLTIKGPCEDIVRVFRKGEGISFDIREIERVTDGHYTWQLSRVASIDPGVQEELQSLRGTGQEDDVWWSFYQKGLIPEGPYTDSGAFTVDRGLIIDPNSGEEKRAAVGSKARAAIETSTVAGLAAAGGTSGGSNGDNPLATKDFVINDDLIVIGSTCIGFDCVNGEVFSFDTLRFKENNLRIKFQDTSGGSFPTRDWEIEVNSSANGGQTHFRINDVDAARSPFTIEGSAPSHSLYVDSSGRVGIRTSNPVVDLHVKDGDTPTLRLEQDTSSGFAAQTWDVAGNETNFFVRDATNGSTLPLRIFPGSPSSTLVIRDGNVGVGTTSPQGDLHIASTDSVRYRLHNTTDATEWDAVNDSSGDFQISLVGTGQSELEIEQDGDIGNCNNPDHDFVISTGPGCTATPRSWIDAGDTQFSITSSRTLKENLAPVTPQGILEKIEQIPVYEYDFISGPQDRIGLMAEDFHSIFQRGSEQELNGSEVQVAMWLAIQELIAKNGELTEQNRSLVKAVEELRNKLD